MPASDYTYDPTGLASANRIENEVHSIIDRGIVLNHGPYFKNELMVEGFDGSNWVPFTAQEHFTYSPMFTRASAATGKEVFSYIVLLIKLSDYQQVRVTYQALGQYEDTGILALVTTLSAQDRTRLSKWNRICLLYTSDAADE